MKALDEYIKDLAGHIATQATAIAEGRHTNRLAAVRLMMATNVDTLKAWILKEDQS